MRWLTLLILIMTGLMDLFRRRPVWAGASAPPGTGPASARAPKLRCAPSRLASRPGGQGARRSRASGLPPGTPGSRPDGGSLPNAAHRRTRQRRQSAPVHANAFETPPCAPGADPYHHSARPGGLAPTGLCTATRNACSAIQNRAPCRLFALVGRPDCEVICVQILQLSAASPARAARRRVPRSRRCTLTAGEWLCVRWSALTCSPLPCALDSRRAKARGRLVPDGAGRQPRRYAGHRRPARRCLYRCVARLAASLLPRGASAGSAPPVAGHRDRQAPTAVASSRRAAFLYDRGDRPRSGDHQRRPCRQRRPHRGPSGTA